VSARIAVRRLQRTQSPRLIGEFMFVGRFLYAGQKGARPGPVSHPQASRDTPHDHRLNATLD
jgi:hypothetical protein